MSAELDLAEAGGEMESDADFWNYFNESVCDIPELQNITGTELINEIEILLEHKISNPGIFKLNPLIFLFHITCLEMHTPR